MGFIMPVNRRSIILLESSGAGLNIISEAIKGDSYYGYTDGLHTIQIQYEDYIGRIIIEGSLAIEPKSSDWFTINVDNFDTDGFAYFKEFASQYSGTQAYTFQGNYTWVRLKIDRSHLGENYDPQYGQIIRAIMSA